jgi:hypothetical protein
MFSCECLIDLRDAAAYQLCCFSKIQAGQVNGFGLKRGLERAFSPTSTFVRA